MSKTKLKIIPLGGLNEIGKNLTCIEYGNDMVIIDCGLGFPEEDMLGIDLVIPDITYLEKNSDKIRGILLTHGHEDHIGALPYVLKTVNAPVYGTGLTIGILENKLLEHELDTVPELVTVEAGDRVSLGCFEAEFIHVNHSIADSCCIALRTPVGTIVHSGDFKLDITPAVGEMMDITRLGEIGREGVLLLMCESTNAERPGYSPSERKVGASFGNLLQTYRNNRIIIATFSSNVHRVQQIIDLSAKYSRKVAITGRSMLNVVGAAVRLGYMNVPDGVLINISEIKKYAPEQLIVVTTGSQGEPMSALYRMTFSGHDKVTLDSNDVVVLSANPIPGNEKLVGKIVNELYRRGVTVVNDATAEVHVSGHACQEELMLMHALTKPKYFMPVHGEYRHLINHKNLALRMGMPAENIFVSAI
ncbi:MAG: ribonuclease J, partial [Clostridia bacterium]|nr:ribonuclease J [Clostridia bacterium]